ncbi:MAG: hypothetical protein IH586_07405 [Anaerolineaceae bacterium]|nr:hypothetical protein [Anaerolineaceae bacterium]
MQKIQIQDLVPGLVAGVEVQMPYTVQPYKERYFEWSGSSLIACLSTNQVTGGVLKTWRHAPVFHEIESHVDAEMFYFVSGVALLLFVNIKAGEPDQQSAQLVRVQPGTQIVIPAGKGHFVPVAEGDDPVEIIVVAPKIDAPRMLLHEEMVGIP